MKARQDPEFKKIDSLLGLIPTKATEPKKKAEPKKEDDKVFMKDLFEVLAKPKKFEKVKRDKALYNAGVLLLNKKIDFEEWRDILATLMTYDIETSKGLPFEFGKGQAPPKF